MSTQHIKKPLLLVTALCMGHSSIHAAPPQDHLTISQTRQKLCFWFNPKHGWRAKSYDQRYPGCTRQQIHRVYTADGISLPDLLRHPNNLHWLPDPQEPNKQALYVGRLGLPGGMPSRRVAERASKDLKQIVLKAVQQDKTCRLQVAMQQAGSNEDFSHVYEKVFGEDSSEQEGAKHLAIFDLTVGEVRELSNYRHHFFTRKQVLLKSSSSSRAPEYAGERKQQGEASDGPDLSSPSHDASKSDHKPELPAKKAGKQPGVSADKDPDLPNPLADEAEGEFLNPDSIVQKQVLGKPLPTHKALMERLSQDLQQRYDQVHGGIVVETALVAQAGIKTPQKGARFRRDHNTTHTNFWLRLSDDESMQLVNYYLNHFPGLLKGFERQDSQWMRVELDTRMLYEQVSPQLGKAASESPRSPWFSSLWG